MVNVWDWPTVVGTCRGLRRLVAILRGRQTLTEAVAGWRPGAAPQ